MYSCKILLDSVNPDGNRLTTFEVTYPRFIHSEMMTHRMFSRNAASSRAIPVQKMIQRVKEGPAMPVHWGQNQKGMQAKEEMSPDKVAASQALWLQGRDAAVKIAEALMDIGAHKQIANRILEPYMWMTVILSGTEFGNFFNLRCHPAAQPEIQKIAYMMRDSYYSSAPQEVHWNHWHTPLVQEVEKTEFSTEDLLKISVGRCARVSYLTHDGNRDPVADIALFDRLKKEGHWSPFEHVAASKPVHEGNFIGWQQYRKFFPEENRKEYKP